MAVWRGYLLLFGGFYEAMREVRWYNDAYIYSFQDRRWALIPQKPNAQVCTYCNCCCVVNRNFDV